VDGCFGLFHLIMKERGPHPRWEEDLVRASGPVVPCVFLLPVRQQLIDQGRTSDTAKAPLGRSPSRSSSKFSSALGVSMLPVQRNGGTQSPATTMQIAASCSPIPTPICE
jgi:hypothetical protein